MKWLNDNWFKLSILLVILLFGSGLFYLANKRISNNTNEMNNQEEAPASDTINDSNATHQTTSPSTVSPKPIAQPYTESWIDLQNGVNAWAYDNNLGYTVALTFQSVHNPSFEFTASSDSSMYSSSTAHQDGSFLWNFRDDAVSELIKKGVNAKVVYGFQFSPTTYANTNHNIPWDDYILTKATFNGMPFQLPSNSSQIYERVCAYNMNIFTCLQPIN